MFYFEESFNKSIKLWKREYFVNKENIRDILWCEYCRIENYVFDQKEYSDWDKCMPWVIYKVISSLELNNNKLNIGETKVIIFEKQFCDNFTKENFKHDFLKEYMGFRIKDLSFVSLDYYMRFYGLNFF